MSDDRHTLRIANEAIRAKALHWVSKAPLGWLIEFSAPRRSDIQSRRMWAMLGDISKQVEHFGLRYEPEAWKLIALAALGKEVRMAPSLHGNGLVPLGISTRRLTKSEMSDLIESLFAFGAEKGVIWSDPTLIQADAASTRRAA
jgi:hypothetical protein